MFNVVKCQARFLKTGDLSVEDSVYEWLTDEENRDLLGQIESVNNLMLRNLIEKNLFVAVLFISKGENYIK